MLRQHPGDQIQVVVVPGNYDRPEHRERLVHASLVRQPGDAIEELRRAVRRHDRHCMSGRNRIPCEVAPTTSAYVNIAVAARVSKDGKGSSFLTSGPIMAAQVPRPGVQAPASPVSAGAPAIDVRRVQRRTLRLLFCTQIIGGVGVAIGISVGALLAARDGRHRRLRAGRQRRGRRRRRCSPSRRPGSCAPAGGGPGWPSPTWSAPSGALVVVVGAALDSVPLLFLGHVRCSAAGPRPTSRPATPPSTWPSRPPRRGSSRSSSGPRRSARSPGPTSPRWPTGRVGPAGAAASTAGPFLFSARRVRGGGARRTRCLLRPDPLLTARTLAAAGSEAAGEPPAVVSATAASGGGPPAVVAGDPRRPASAWPRSPSGTW